MAMGQTGQNFEDINVTPLTDVFLVLLVIMILIAPLIDKSDLKIKPPETRNAKKDDASKAIFIDVDKTGKIAINSKELPAGATTEEIQAKIKDLQVRAGRDDVPVTVNADGDAKQRDVVAIMTAAAAAGIKRMRVATVQESQY
ncbi:MAG: biopolymer transporter ExbD [Candidatus Obscuribacterales bacterium]|nr:biopolymer transporter ExbD [Candidatus Obscuribacterales bacterium]